MLKVLFAGTPDVAVPSLKMLAEDTERFEWSQCSPDRMLLPGVDANWYRIP